MVKVREIMTRNPVKIEAGKTVREAINLMTQKKLGSLLVCQGEEITGILEEADIIRNVLARDLNFYVTKVGEVMSDPIAIDDERSDDEASDMMNLHHVRHLVVTSGSRISGILSMLDLIRPIYSGRSFWV